MDPNNLNVILVEGYFYGLKSSLKNNLGLLLQTGPLINLCIDVNQHFYTQLFRLCSPHAKVPSKLISAEHRFGVMPSACMQNFLFAGLKNAYTPFDQTVLSCLTFQHHLLFVARILTPIINHAATLRSRRSLSFADDLFIMIQRPICRRQAQHSS